MNGLDLIKSVTVSVEEGESTKHEGCKIRFSVSLSVSASVMVKQKTKKLLFQTALITTAL